MKKVILALALTLFTSGVYAQTVGKEVIQVLPGSMSSISAAKPAGPFALTATDAAARVDTLVNTALVAYNRCELSIQNQGTEDVYLGFASNMAATAGIKLAAGQTISFAMGKVIPVYAIMASGKTAKIVYWGFGYK